MSRQKRNSRMLDKAEIRLASIKSISKAEIRLASIKSISPTLDLGEGLTVQDYTQKIESLRKSLEAYNTTLSTIDVLLTQIVEYEQDLGDYSENILRGIAYKFGNNSHEYQMAGGTRKSDRKRTVRQSMVLTNT